jgi:hypothetical protein
VEVCLLKIAVDVREHAIGFAFEGFMRSRASCLRAHKMKRFGQELSLIQQIQDYTKAYPCQVHQRPRTTSHC